MITIQKVLNIYSLHKWKTSAKRISKSACRFKIMLSQRRMVRNIFEFQYSQNIMNEFINNVYRNPQIVEMISGNDR